MSKVKKSFITIISLISALFLLLGLVVGLPRYSAYANTYSPGNVFSAGTGGTVDASTKGEGAGAKSYVQFTFSDGGKVYFRRDLALKWYAEEEVNAPSKQDENTTDDGKTDGETKPETKPETVKEVKLNYFSMQFAFVEVAFEKFTISFESA